MGAETSEPRCTMAKLERYAKAKLKGKQYHFIGEYLIDFNATAAARRVGYSEKSAKKVGPALLRNPMVALVIHERTKRHVKSLKITAKRTLKEIGRLAFLDPRKLFDQDGNLKAITDLDDDTAAAVAAVEVVVKNVKVGSGENFTFEPEITKKIKFADKNSALEKLGKYFKMFTETRVVVGDPNRPIETKSKLVLEDLKAEDFLAAILKQRREERQAKKEADESHGGGGDAGIP